MKSNLRTGFFAMFSTVLVVSFLFIGTGCSGGAGGAAGSASMSVSTRQIASGNVILGTAVDQPVTITNSGSANLNIGMIAGTDSLAPPFWIVSDHCSDRSLPPSGSCTFQVRFLPTAEGSFSDTFDISSDAANEPSSTVSVSGTGKALRVILNQVNTASCGTGVLELLVSVMTSSNVPVAGLGSGNFQLSENGVVQTISSVAPNSTPASLSLAEVLDYSTSLNNWISTMESTSATFISAMKAGDEAAIIKFAQLSQLMQDFTTDKTSLTAAVNADPTAIGSREETHLYDALWFAIEKTAPRLHNKVIILISDGKDEDANFVPNASVKSLSDVIAYAVDNSVAIFTVGLGNANGVVMNQLAGGTGGQYFYAPSTNQLPGIYTAIGTLVSGQYVITYNSSQCGTSGVMLKVAVTSNGQDGEVSRQTP